MQLISARLMSEPEEALLSAKLHLPNRLEIKSGLQRLSDALEAGRRPRNQYHIRQSVVALLWNTDVLVRRWAYKVLALLGYPEDFPPIRSRLTDENDPENRTWGIAALAALSVDQTVADLCATVGYDISPAYELAACIFRRYRGKQLSCGHITLDIERDTPLALKWAALLEGYGEAPPGIFESSQDNRCALTILNRHDAPDVSEYSVWALSRRSDTSLDDLGLSPSEFLKKPAQVRRWFYRFVTKSSDLVAENIDLIQDLRRERDEGAREGLALGLRRVFVPSVAAFLVGWYTSEDEDRIRRVLLEHMARFASTGADYAELTMEAYRSDVGSAGSRTHILAAAEGTPLYAQLKSLELEEQAARLVVQGVLFPTSPVININQENNVSNNTFNVGRDLKAQNLIGGDVKSGSVSSIVNQMPTARGDEKEVLGSILRMLAEHPDIDPALRFKTEAAVKEVAESASPKAKANLIEGVKLIASGATIGTAVAKVAAELLPHLHHLFG